MAFFGFGIPPIVLDEEFDAPDIGADRELCRAIAAGRMGLHPDAWGNHHSFAGPRLPARDWDNDWPPLRAHVLPVDRKPPKPPKPPKPKWQISWTWVPTATPAVDDPYGGTIELTCDDCRVRFKILTNYDHGQRARRAAQLRTLGAKEGWTHIVGRDRCPVCSGILAPDDIGDGAMMSSL